MFLNLLREAAVDPFDYDQDKKVPILEHLFKGDSIKLAVAYNLACSHEYDKPNVRAALVIINNYDWSLVEIKVDDMQGLDKPTNEAKVFDIATTIKTEGDTTPLVVVDKLHNLTPQSKDKVILIDGHHRKKGLKFAGKETTKVYKGTYNGNAEKTDEQLLMVETFIYEKMDYVLTESNTVITEAFKIFPSEQKKKAKEVTRQFLHSTQNDYMMGILNGGKHLSDYHSSVKSFVNKNKNNEHVLKRFKTHLKGESSYSSVNKNLKAGNEHVKFVASMMPIIDGHIKKASDPKAAIKESVEGVIMLETYSIEDLYIEALTPLFGDVRGLLEAAAKNKIEKVSLTPAEYEAVKAKYGEQECTFHKDAKSGKYFCTTHRARSGLFDSPTDIPIATVKNISSTS